MPSPIVIGAFWDVRQSGYLNLIEVASRFSEFGCGFARFNLSELGVEWWFQDPRRVRWAALRLWPHPDSPDVGLTGIYYYENIELLIWFDVDGGVLLGGSAVISGTAKRVSYIDGEGGATIGGSATIQGGYPNSFRVGSVIYELPRRDPTDWPKLIEGGVPTLWEGFGPEWEYDEKMLSDAIDNSGLNRIALPDDTNNNIDNYLFADLWFEGWSGTSTDFSSGGAVDVYMICELLEQDGTSFEDGDETTDPPRSNYVGSFVFSTDVDHQSHIMRQVPIPPCMFKFLLINKADNMDAVKMQLKPYRYKVVETAVEIV